MAARSVKDPWLDVARKQRTADVPELFETLTSESRPATERRLSALLSWPPSKALARHAATLLRAFPFDGWALAGATRALGLALLKGAAASAFEPTRLARTTDDVEAWRGPALEAARRFIARGTFAAPKPFATTALPLAPRQALQQAWLERAASRNPDALPTLLEHLGDGPSTDLCARSLELLEFPRDARIADVVAELLVYPTVKPRAENPLFLLLGLLLCAHGDKQHGAALRALAKKVPALEWLPAPVDSAKPVKRAPAPKKDDATFLQGIVEAPGDLARRSVYADWLSERGDPRGEFITLQLAAAKAPLAPKAAARMAALQKKHARTWLRSLDRCLFVKGREVFENGFLAEVSLRVTDFVPRPSDPVLATIARLGVWGGEGAAVKALLGAPLLAQVRSFTGSPTLAAALCPAALERLEVLATELQSRADLEVLRALRAPSLTTLRLDKGVIDSAGERYTPEELYALPCLRQVKHLTIRCSVTPGPWLQAAVKLRALETLIIEAPTQFDFHFDVTTSPARLRVRPRSYFTPPDERDAEYLLLGPLTSLAPEVRRGAVVELPAGVKLPVKSLRRLSALEVPPPP